MAAELFSFESDSERWGDEEEEAEKKGFQRTPMTVIQIEVFIVLTVVSLYIAAPTLRVIEQSLNASEQNI